MIWTCPSCGTHVQSFHMGGLEYKRCLCGHVDVVDDRSGYTREDWERAGFDDFSIITVDTN